MQHHHRNQLHCNCRAIQCIVHYSLCFHGVCVPVWGECMHVLECVYLLLYCIFVLHCMDQSKSHTLHRQLPDTACLVILWSKWSLQATKAIADLDETIKTCRHHKDFGLHGTCTVTMAATCNNKNTAITEPNLAAGHIFFHLRAHNQHVDYSGTYNWGCSL